MTAICNALSGFISDFIRSDFERRLKLAEAMADFSGI
jgi:hypothetical protein